MALRSLSQTCPQLVNLGDDGCDGDDHDVDEDDHYYGSSGGGDDDYGLRHFFIFFCIQNISFHVNINNEIQYYRQPHPS